MKFEPTQLLETPAIRVARADAHDAERIANFYLGLSLDSRYERFFSPRLGYTPEELARLSHPDLEHEICLIAVVGEGDNAIVVGDLRCVAIDPGAVRAGAPEKEGEIALVVADEWRRRGIGRLLLCSLIAHARVDNFTGMLAYVSSTNTGMQNLIREFDFHVEPLAGDASMRLLKRPLAQAWGDTAWLMAQPRCRGFILGATGAGAAANVLHN